MMTLLVRCRELSSLFLVVERWLPDGITGMMFALLCKRSLLDV
jgi:hypothetical protein